jgi:hypothetical protein
VKIKLVKDIRRLLEVVNNATPGPWHLSSEKPFPQRIIQTAHATRDVWEIPKCDDDMPYIAAMNPQVTALLLDVCEKAAVVDNIYTEGGDLRASLKAKELLSESLRNLAVILEARP